MEWELPITAEVVGDVADYDNLVDGWMKHPISEKQGE